MPRLVPLGLVACFSPQPTTGLPCAPPGAPSRCPSDLVCVDSGGVETCEATGSDGVDAAQSTDARPIDGAPDLDSDGDGVVDSADNCPQATNTDQADEDSDGLGDVCDACPIDADNSDPDLDDVGGPCDPDPSTPGNAIVAFAGFASGLSSGWSAVGAVMYDQGDAIIDSGATEIVVTTDAPAIARLVVGMRVTPLAFTTTLGGIGVVQRRAPASENAIACQLVATSGGSPRALRIYDLDANVTVNEGAHAIEIGESYFLVLARDGDDYACGASNPDLEIGGASTYSPASPRTGVRVRNAAARVHWAIVVSRP